MNFRHGAASMGWAAGAALLLAACSSGDEPAPPATQAEEHIACAVGGSAQLADVCSVERTQADGALVLVVHHPDGAFRRFDVTTDGTGVAVTDGAEPAQVWLVDGKLDVTVGPDRYVFPATARTNAAK